MLLCILVTGGCAESVTLVHETPAGGIVTYPFIPGRGHLASPHRKEALKLVSQRCPSGYTIIRDEEAKGSRQVVDSIAGQEIITEYRWGIQFKCDRGSGE